MNTFSDAEFARHIEHALTRPDATARDIEQLCSDARDHGFYGVCLNGSRVALAYALLEDTDLKVTALVGFPLGAADRDVKRYETEVAIDHGAHEIEMMLNAGQIKDGNRNEILRELRDIAEAADERPVKIVIPTPLLTVEQWLECCELALDSGVHCVCAGMETDAPPAIEHVKLLREAVGQKFGVKASGAIPDAQTALALLDAGADRLGTANGVTLLRTLKRAAELPQETGDA